MAKGPALLCRSCSSGSKKDDCVKCGRNNSKIQAHLCYSCGSGSKKDNCIKCGRRAN